MINKVLKKAYKLRASGHSNGEVAKYFKMNGILNYSRKYFEEIFKHRRFDRMSNYEINLCCRVYRNTMNIEKAINYINNKYRLKVTRASLTQMCHRRGVKRLFQDGTKFKNNPRNIEKEISRLYLNGETSASLCEKFGYKTQKSISDILRKRNIKMRTQEENDRLKGLYDLSFEVIDSLVKAYFIGFMLSDGNVIVKYGESYGIQLNSTDKEVIELFSTEFSRKHNIYMPYGNNISLVYKPKNTHRINIAGKRYAEQVARFGIVPRKSLILEAPSLLESEIKYIPYIIRGIIDGDGWIRKDGKEFFICSASCSFISWCKDSLESIGMTNLKVTAYISDRPNTGRTQMYMVRSALKSNIVVLNTIVYDKNFGMIRKYERLKGRSETIIGSC